jgi:hypothetical protein
MIINKEAIDKLIISLIDKFKIQKKIAYRAIILKAIDEDKVNDMNELLAGIALLTLKFKQEEEDGYKLQQQSN